ncbi:MAG TPA: hypothetical protein VF691_06505 [Cytophagaceae bacterium]|jgi:hypothetical protein
MANFFKKALGVFLEFEEDPNSPANPQPVTADKNHTSPIPIGVVKPHLNPQDIDKFGKHFDKLFEQTNLPGPDYFEFCKMMETLEAHIPDEKARMAAVFASLAIQGLTKQKLLDSATQYKLVVDKDKSDFDSAVNEKTRREIESRKKILDDLEKRIIANSELIQNLTKEITEAQTQIGTVKNQITEEQNKIAAKSGGYMFACEAMLNKIVSDIQKLQTNL